MKSSLPKKIKKAFKKEGLYQHLIKYVEKKFEDWQDHYRSVVGINITKKLRKGKKINRYAIIFHVVNKTNVLPQIPKSLTISYKGKKIKIPTDVIETGQNELTYIHPGQNGFEFNRVNTAGTLGPVVSKNNEPYVLSNMHVFGLRFLENGNKSINKIINSNSPIDINCQVNDSLRPVGIFQSGIVNSLIDAAVAFIPQQLRQFVRSMNDVFDVTNPIILPNEVIKNPFPVQMIGNVSGVKRSKVISGIGIATFNYPFGTQSIFKMIQLSPCCNQPGDSGSPVFEPFSKRIVGIVLGRDFKQQFTYVIPYQTIREALIID